MSELTPEEHKALREVGVLAVGGDLKKAAALEEQREADIAEEATMGDHNLIPHYKARIAQLERGLQTALNLLPSDHMLTDDGRDSIVYLRSLLPEGTQIVKAVASTGTDPEKAAT